MFDSLPARLLLGVIAGIAIGLVCPGLVVNGVDVGSMVMQVILTLKNLMSSVISFCVPLIVIGFIAPSITRLQSNASRMLGLALIVAYTSSVCAALMSMAAGCATMGKVVFASSFAMFAAGRAFEQIRNSIGYPALNVKIAASHGGISVGEDGASHQCCEDFALMRSIPGMVVICPADDVEAKAAVKAAYEYEGPVYLRFGRLAVPVFHDAEYKFEIGKGEIVKDGTDVAIIANGLMVYEAIKAGQELAEAGINAMVINMPTIKPLDEELVIAAAKKCGKVITCEEHSVIGGLGEAVCSLLSEKLPTPVKRIGVNDEFGHSGPAVELLKQFGLCASNIVAVAKDFCK